MYVYQESVRVINSYYRPRRSGLIKEKGGTNRNQSMENVNRGDFELWPPGRIRKIIKGEKMR